MTEGEEADPDAWWDEIFGSNPRPTREQRTLHSLMSAKAEQDKSIRELRRDLRVAQSQIRRVRNASLSLLSPILFGGIIAFSIAFAETDGLWGKLLVVAVGAFGIWWLRDVGKSFDDATRD